MGTRADFYVGRGVEAEWLGSIAWDGNPAGIPSDVLTATTEPDYRDAVAAFFTNGRDDVTLPEMGWPWPWEDSLTTDYAYAFEGRVHASRSGDAWFDPNQPQPESSHSKVAVFPDMSARKKVTFGKRSGLIILGAEVPDDD